MRRDRAAHAKALRARHYSVIPVGPRAGLIRWVPGPFPPPLPRANWTSLVPPLVLSGHAASLTPYRWVPGTVPLFRLYKEWQARQQAADGADGAAGTRPAELFYDKVPLHIPLSRAPAACPLRTRGGTRLVRLVRGRGGGGGVARTHEVLCASGAERARPRGAGCSRTAGRGRPARDRAAQLAARRAPQRLGAAHRRDPPRPAGSGARPLRRGRRAVARAAPCCLRGAGSRGCEWRCSEVARL